MSRSTSITISGIVVRCSDQNRTDYDNKCDMKTYLHSLCCAFTTAHAHQRGSMPRILRGRAACGLWPVLCAALLPTHASFWEGRVMHLLF